LNGYRSSLPSGKLWGAAIVQTGSLPQRLFAGTVAGTTAQRYGIPPINIGAPYGSAMLNSKNGERCQTPHFDEETIKDRFIAAFNTLLENRARLLDDCRLMQTELTDCSTIDEELSELYQEMDVVEELTRKCVEQNSQSTQSQEEYIARYNCPK